MTRRPIDARHHDPDKLERRSRHNAYTHERENAVRKSARLIENDSFFVRSFVRYVTLRYVRKVQSHFRQQLAHHERRAFDEFRSENRVYLRKVSLFPPGRGLSSFSTAKPSADATLDSRCDLQLSFHVAHRT